MIETLATFLRYDPRGVRRGGVSLRRAPQITNAPAVTTALRAHAGDAVAQGALKLLNSPLAELVGDAWGKLDELAKYRDPAAFPPDKVNELTLHAHEIALKRTPALELVLNGVPTGLMFDCELKIGLTIESAVLRIQNTRIVGAEIGKARGGGSFKCLDVTLAERKTAPVRFPGRHAFVPGIRLR